MRYKNIFPITGIHNEVLVPILQDEVFLFENDNLILLSNTEIKIPKSYVKALDYFFIKQEEIKQQDLGFTELVLDDTIIKDYRINLDFKLTEKQAYTLNIEIRHFLDNYLKNI